MQYSYIFAIPDCQKPKRVRFAGNNKLLSITVNLFSVQYTRDFCNIVVVWNKSFPHKTIYYSRVANAWTMWVFSTVIHLLSTFFDRKPFWDYSIWNSTQYCFQQPILRTTLLCVMRVVKIFIYFFTARCYKLCTRSNLKLL